MPRIPKKIPDKPTKPPPMPGLKYDSEKPRWDASKREPMPIVGKTDVLPEVIKDLQSRDKIGTQKYGTTLQTHNGRNSLMDAYQEALDLVMYLKQALIEQENPT